MKNMYYTEKEIRSLHNKAVKVKIIDKEQLYHGENVGVIDVSDPNDSDNGVYLYGQLYSIKEYGKTWLAYEYKN